MHLYEFQGQFVVSIILVDDVLRYILKHFVFLVDFFDQKFGVQVERVLYVIVVRQELGLWRRVEGHIVKSRRLAHLEQCAASHRIGLAAVVARHVWHLICLVVDCWLQILLEKIRLATNFAVYEEKKVAYLQLKQKIEHKKTQFLLFRSIPTSMHRLKRHALHAFRVLKLISQLPLDEQTNFFASVTFRLKKPLQPSHVIAPKWSPDESSEHTLHGILLKDTAESLDDFSTKNKIEKNLKKIQRQFF